MRAVRPALHWPSIRGRARADWGPLLLVAIVITAICLMAAAVPPLIRGTADRATQDAVREAGDEADVLAQAPWEDDYATTDIPDPTGGFSLGRARAPRLSADLDDLAGRAKNDLDPSLRTRLKPAVITVSSISLAVTDGSVQRHFELEYLKDDNGGPAVTWVSGGPPRATAEEATIPLNGPPWPVQVGVSEAEAAALGVHAGDAIKVEDAQYEPYAVKVSGVFRPRNADDPAWQLRPWVLHPVADLDGVGSTRFGGLLSADSVPDARLAFRDDQLTRTVSFAVNPGDLTWESTQKLAATVAKLKADSASSSERDTSLRWDTQLDSVLRDVRAQIDAASAQASVLLIAVLAGAVLVLLLAADLLVRRRRSALVATRQRGAGLSDIAAELLIESVAVTVPAAALGVALAFILTGGAALTWAAPVIVTAVIAGPAFGTVTAARGTRDKRAPANRTARRFEQRTAQIRRAAVDVAILAAAVGAVVALRQRGIGAGLSSDSALPASAPALGVIAVAAVLLRLIPRGARLVLRQTLRSRRALPVFGAARAAAASVRLLPLLVVTAAIALASFAVTLDATTEHGLADGAWSSVGADARLDLEAVPAASASAAAATVARQLSAAPGVDQVVPGQVTTSIRIVADNTAVTPSLVIVDAGAYQRLLAATPLPDAPALSQLKAAGKGATPALVLSSDGSLRPGMSLRMLRDGEKEIPLVAVGTAPAVDNAPDVVVLDTAAAAAAGLPTVPTTMWVTGPGAARAVAAVPTSGHAVVRADVLEDRRGAPLVAGLVKLNWAAAATLLALGLLGFALGAAASTPERWETLARLRTLGLRPRDARRVAAAELLPPVLVGGLAAPFLGLLLVRLTFGSLSLGALTSQLADPGIVVPWWALGLAIVALLATLAVVVAAETSARRRQRLGDVLRAGGG